MRKHVKTSLCEPGGFLKDAVSGGILASGRIMSEAPDTHVSLLLRLRDAGDQQAWAEFVEMYAPLVYRLARRYGLQDADAADLTQDALGAAAAALPRFDYDAGRGSFRGWLLTVARNLLRKFLRSRRRQPAGGGDPAIQALLAQHPAPNEVEEWERDYRRRLFDYVARCVRAQFRPSTWEAFWRTAVGGEDPQAVAAALGLSVGAVYIARTRVLARVREEVRQLESLD
jgi:RNA polymerase sigma-70 factor (ECF subfamily)